MTFSIRMIENVEYQLLFEQYQINTEANLLLPNQKITKKQSFNFKETEFEKILNKDVVRTVYHHKVPLFHTTSSLKNNLRFKLESHLLYVNGFSLNLFLAFSKLVQPDYNKNEQIIKVKLEKLVKLTQVSAKGFSGTQTDTVYTQVLLLKSENSHLALSFRDPSFSILCLCGELVTQGDYIWEGFDRVDLTHDNKKDGFTSQNNLQPLIPSD